MKVAGWQGMAAVAAMMMATGGVAADGTVAREDAFGMEHPVIDVGGAAQIALDRRDAAYACGQEAVFTVTVRDTNGVRAASGRVTWRLDNYGAHQFAAGEADLAAANPFTVKGTLPYPGFLRLVVRDGKGRQLRAYSAAYDMDRIRPAVPKPADFDSFWDEAQARLEREVPLDPQIEPVPALSKNGIVVSRVSFATFGGRVYGVLSRPADASKGPFPARVQCPGAGPGFVLSSGVGRPDAVLLTMSVHRFPMPADSQERQAAYQAQEEKCRAIHGPNRARAYPVTGLTVSREAAYYFPVILGINRAVSWLAKLPEVDRRHIVYSGASQGGGFGLYLAALNRNITRAYIGVPALADVMGCKADGRQSGWPRILEFESQTDPRRLAQIEKNAPYLDGAYFAERITIPVRLSVGYADESCAPHAVLAAYNMIPSKDKKLYHGIGGVHSSPNAPMAVINRWLAE